MDRGERGRTSELRRVPGRGATPAHRARRRRAALEDGVARFQDRPGHGEGAGRARSRGSDGMTESLTILDTTLRDGEQSPGVALNAEDKLQIAHQLARLKVDVIEAGFPHSSPGDFAAVRAIAEQVDGAGIPGLSRFFEDDFPPCAAAREPAARARLP